MFLYISDLHVQYVHCTTVFAWMMYCWLFLARIFQTPFDTVSPSLSPVNLKSRLDSFSLLQSPKAIATVSSGKLIVYFRATRKLCH